MALAGFCGAALRTAGLPMWAALLAGVAWQAAAQAGDSLSGQDPVRAFLKLGGKAAVPLEEILRGGPAVDGIPALSAPKKVSAKEGDALLASGDAVLGLSLDGEAAAYPVRLLNWHEIANDTVGGVPVAVTYCPLCKSGIVFDRRLDGKATEFGVSGLLYKSALILYDRATRSLWSQIMGRAIAGPATGRSLTRIPAVHTTWKEWRAEHPRTTVAAFDTGHARDYGRDPYAGYESSREIYFPTGKPDDRLHPKETVFGVRVGEAALAVPVKLVREKGSLRASLAGQEIEFKHDGGVRAHGEQGEIPGTVAYWFAWSAFHPKTELLLVPR